MTLVIALYVTACSLTLTVFGYIFVVFLVYKKLIDLNIIHVLTIKLNRINTTRTIIFIKNVLLLTTQFNCVNVFDVNFKTIAMWFSMQPKLLFLKYKITMFANYMGNILLQ